MSRLKIGDGHVLTFERGQLRDVQHPRGERDECAWQRALDLGTEYLDYPPETLREADVPDWPPVLVVVGTMEEVVYSSRKWDGELRLFHHTFGRDGRRKIEKPVLAVHPDGAPLFVVGGGARVTDRGIVG